jgi:hypothetical protein
MLEVEAHILFVSSTPFVGFLYFLSIPDTIVTGNRKA